MVYKPIAFFDPPKIIDTSVTPIPASTLAPLQVIDNSGIESGVGIEYADTTGAFIGVYIGSVGHEQLVCVIGGGFQSIAFGRFPTGSRVSIRAMENAQITAGKLSGNLVTK